MNQVFSHVDLTFLKPTATEADVKALCNKADELGTASVCVPPCYVKAAKRFLQKSPVCVCTVSGFPNGYSDTLAKVRETEIAVKQGADEVDAVINIGAVRAHDWDYIGNELAALRSVTEGRVLKVIIETCYIDDSWILEKLCDLFAENKVDYIKTSTGFGTAGAVLEDVKVMADHISSKGLDLKVKAAGGIRTLDQARAFLEAGADRIGASNLA